MVANSHYGLLPYVHQTTRHVDGKGIVHERTGKTVEELQRAVDSIHNSVYGENGKYSGRGGANLYSLIVTNDDMLVLAKN